ncbi:Uncharacterised protein [Mycobacterium tuberculosis]|nr:Uncharacterised protein [Mycobacterium tuberculosis]
MKESEENICFRLVTSGKKYALKLLNTFMVTLQNTPYFLIKRFLIYFLRLMG